MTLALGLARRGEGLVEPNPMVGCVIVKNGVVIGRGYHRRFGGPHAEVEALRSCKTLPAGATMYCTLEPCSHTGKTPPCVDAVIQAKVSRVIIPQLDPNPQVNGRGVRMLRRAGIKVEVGLLTEQADFLLRPFVTRILCNRPYVIAKWAQSIDGRLITDPKGPPESRWISGEASRRRVHQLRARVDAIMVGAGTVLRDDPLLTARDVPLRRSAMRWVIDGRLRIATTSKLVRTARRFATVVFTTSAASDSRKAATLRRAGVEVLPCKSRGGVIALDDLLGSPMFSGVTNVLVEGGPTLLNQFFRDDLVDEAHIYVAPRLLGSSSKSDDVVSFGSRAPQSIGSAPSGVDTLYTLFYATPHSDRNT